MSAPENGERTIRFRLVDRFGKQGHPDYTWLEPSNTLPNRLRRGLEAAVASFAKSAHKLALFLDTEEEIFLVRSYHEGLDGAGRRVIGLEIFQLPEERELTPVAALTLLSAMLGWSSEEQEESNFEVPAPSLTATARDPNEEQILRTRLGLPCSASAATSLALAAQKPWRYEGFCYFYGKGAHPDSDWMPHLGRLFGVSLPTPSLDPRQRQWLDTLLSEPPSTEEWRQLDSLDTADLWRGLDWLADGATGPLPCESPEDPLLPWLCSRLTRDDDDGWDLCQRLEQRLPSDAWSTALIADLLPELSESTARWLFQRITGCNTRIESEALVELALEGYLERPGTLLPVQDWIRLGTEHRAIAEAAEKRLRPLGISPEITRFLLDLEPPEEGTEAPQHPTPEDASRARSWGLGTPKGSMLRWARSLSSANQARAFLDVARVYGGRMEVLGRLIVDSEFRAFKELEDNHLILGLDKRLRYFSRPDTLLRILAQRLGENRYGEARQLLTALREPLEESPRDGASLYASLAARIGLGSPAPPPPAAMLQTLARVGLLRPQDLDLATSTLSTLRRCAEIWPHTRWLTDLLDRRAPHLEENWRNLPETWLPALREHLAPSRFATLLLHAPASEWPETRCWIVEIHGLDPELLAFWGEDRPSPQVPLSPEAIEWLGILATTESPTERRRLLARPVAEGSTPHLGEATARRFVRTLLPEAHDREIQLALHALCGRGPLPSLDEISPDFLLHLLPALEPAAVVDRLFFCHHPVEQQDLLHALAQRLRETGAPPPNNGYLSYQRSAQPLLAQTLAQLPRWEELDPDLESRRTAARLALERLGVDPAELLTPEQDPKPNS